MVQRSLMRGLAGAALALPLLLGAPGVRPALAQNDSCRGECDEAGIGTGACLPNTDSADCSGAAAAGDNSCRYANDNECDEPGIGTGARAADTDSADCDRGAAASTDSCQFANDDECDEPGIGTGYCIAGTDATDCGGRIGVAGDDSCRYAFDDECDEPGMGTGVCGAATDSSDCRPTPPTAEGVTELQRLLAKLGYQPGPADGIVGNQTEAAIRMFEHDFAMQDTGVATNSLLHKLRLAATSRQRRPAGGVTGPAAALPPILPALAPDPLDAVGVYAKVQAAIYVVFAAASAEAIDSGEYSQGSAVAVTDRLLLTNCHVVEGELFIVLSQDEQRHPARLVGADSASDRCVLEAMDGSLKPVEGVRPHSDLRVGEKAYTVGAPEGLERTLGEGIVSALRVEEGVKVVQTSAPISSGSSGGGLFDASGNLLGITTRQYKDAQALNFAIAADEFWRE
jgi:peptidoglycan hydrolase-like protein with peptidoglycan-binding domain